MAPNRTEGRTAGPRLHRAANTSRAGALPGSKELAPPRRPFGEWLRVQLRSRRMSQRQLASRSGISHATISRILGEEREPNLGTAMKLAAVLLELDDEREADHYVGLIASLRGANPATRVERALRADDVLDELTVRRIMDYYLAVRQVPARPRDRSA